MKLLKKMLALFIVVGMLSFSNLALAKQKKSIPNILGTWSGNYTILCQKSLQINKNLKQALSSNAHQSYNITQQTGHFFTAHSVWVWRKKEKGGHDYAKGYTNKGSEDLMGHISTEAAPSQLGLYKIYMINLNEHAFYEGHLINPNKMILTRIEMPLHNACLSEYILHRKGLRHK